MMLNRLQKVEKRTVGRQYSQHPLYKALIGACKPLECEMAAFRLSPEEVFADTLATLDRLKGDPDGAETLCLGLWDTLYCEYREAGAYTVPEAELARAVSVTMLSVAACLDVYASCYYNRFVKMLLHSVSTHQPRGGDDFRRMVTTSSDLAELGRWIDGYMAGDDFMTDEDGMLGIFSDKGGYGATPASMHINTGGGSVIMGGNFQDGTTFTQIPINHKHLEKK